MRIMKHTFSSISCTAWSFGHMTSHQSQPGFVCTQLDISQRSAMCMHKTNITLDLPAHVLEKWLGWNLTNMTSDYGAYSLELATACCIAIKETRFCMCIWVEASHFLTSWEWITNLYTLTYVPVLLFLLTFQHISEAQYEWGSSAVPQHLPLAPCCNHTMT